MIDIPIIAVNQDQNRIVAVHLDLEDGWWMITVTKEFAAEYGGGSQQFKVNAGSQVHRALDLAREMVTVSPGSRVDPGATGTVRYPGQSLVTVVSTVSES